MKITRIEIFKADLPLKRVFRIAIGEIKVAKSVFVRVHTDDGIYGVGEGNLLTQVTS
ncbi:dipeptide epimerase, partial [Candidatus Bipolaricaulota bacterium]|nr:dipeptide epimerase [Candidatus Bipolaricaulota bacterium]